MIDPHVHARDDNQRHKETLEHALEVSYVVGLDGFFEMPNTDEPLTSFDNIVKRLIMGDEAREALREKYPDFKVFHGIHAGLTKDPKQIKDVLRIYNAFKNRDKEIVGLKMYAGHSTGNMGIIEEEDQKKVFKTLVKLGYEGVLTVHCEKESELKPKLWDPTKPVTHTYARPPESETISAGDIFEFAHEAGFKGTLNIAHISVPGTLTLVEKTRKFVDYKITTEIAPHHAVMYDKMMNRMSGLFLKMNPPLREKHKQEYMLDALLKGRIDMIGTDHAPHTRDEKVDKKLKMFASGIPGLPYIPYFIDFLMRKGMTEKRLNAVTHGNVNKIFGLNIKNSKRVVPLSRKELNKLATEYEFDAFEYARNL